MVEYGILKNTYTELGPASEGGAGVVVVFKFNISGWESSSQLDEEGKSANGCGDDQEERLGMHGVC